MRDWTFFFILGAFWAVGLGRCNDSDWEPDEVCEVHCENSRPVPLIAAQLRGGTCQCWYEKGDL